MNLGKSRRADALLDQAKRKKRRPPGTNLLDEDISVSPHDLPGILSQTMGGPDRKKMFRQAPIEGPRGIASAEEPKKASRMKQNTLKRLARSARILKVIRKIATGLDLTDLMGKVNKINAAIQSGKLPPEKMQQASQMLANLTMQMAKAIEASQKNQAA